MGGWTRTSERIRELERGSRRDGLPNLIVDLSATDDIFTRLVRGLVRGMLVQALPVVGR